MRSGTVLRCNVSCEFKFRSFLRRSWKYTHGMSVKLLPCRDQCNVSNLVKRAYVERLLRDSLRLSWPVLLKTSLYTRRVWLY